MMKIGKAKKTEILDNIGKSNLHMTREDMSYYIIRAIYDKAFDEILMSLHRTIVEMTDDSIILY